jgi:hypothetical protein
MGKKTKSRQLKAAATGSSWSDLCKILYCDFLSFTTVAFNCIMLHYVGYDKREVVVISVEVVVESFDHIYDLKTELDVAFETSLYNGK